MAKKTTEIPATLRGNSRFAKHGNVFHEFYEKLVELGKSEKAVRWMYLCTHNPIQKNTEIRNNLITIYREGFGEFSYILDSLIEKTNLGLPRIDETGEKYAKIPGMHRVVLGIIDPYYEALSLAAKSEGGTVGDIVAAIVYAYMDEIRIGDGNDQYILPQKWSDYRNQWFGNSHQENGAQDASTSDSVL